MIVASDKWLGRHKKIYVRFMKIYGQSTNIPCFNTNLQKSDINGCRKRQWLGRHEKICVRFMKIYGLSHIFLVKTKIYINLT